LKAGHARQAEDCRSQEVEAIAVVNEDPPAKKDWQEVHRMMARLCASSWLDIQPALVSLVDVHHEDSSP